MSETGIPPGPWYVPGKWFVSPYCFLDEVRANYDLPDKIYVRDITLAEGQHAMGVNYTMDGMVELARALVEAGVSTIKQHGGDFRPIDFIKRCTKEVPEVKVSVLLGASSETKLVDSFIDAGAAEIELLGGAAQIARCIELIPHIEARGVEPTAGCSNALRMPWEEVWGVCSAAIAAGAKKIDVYDTYNVGTPDAVRYFIKKLKKAIRGRVPIHWQSHNDFGMGTICSVAAVEGGASWLDLSAAGLGDRSGNGSLEETALILESMLGVKTGIKMERLWDLARLTEKISGVKRDTLKAIVGEACYFHESEPHAWMVLQHGLDAKYINRAEPFSPFIIGSKRNVRIGGTSLGLIPRRLDQLGLKYTEKHVEKIRDIIVELWTKKKEDMSIEEFDALAKKIIRGS